MWEQVSLLSEDATFLRFTIYMDVLTASLFPLPVLSKYRQFLIYTSAFNTLETARLY